MKHSVPVVALVGYTNAGKSTLLNWLTGAGIPANNRLFDTLDTTSRQLEVNDTLRVILSDTVGFISKLPHHLVDAFRATLEELSYADLLIHVIDASDPGGRPTLPWWISWLRSWPNRMCRSFSASTRRTW